jgi:hypothetical protein
MTKPKDPLLPPEHPLCEPLADLAVKALRHHQDTNDQNSWELFWRLSEILESTRQGAVGQGDQGPVVDKWCKLVRNTVTHHGRVSNPNRVHDVALAVLTQLQFVPPLRLVAPKACNTEALIAYHLDPDGLEAESCRTAIELISAEIEPILHRTRDEWTAVKVARRSLKALALDADKKWIDNLPWRRKSRNQKI